MYPVTLLWGLERGFAARRGCERVPPAVMSQVYGQVCECVQLPAAAHETGVSKHWDESGGGFALEMPLGGATAGAGESNGAWCLSCTSAGREQLWARLRGSFGHFFRIPALRLFIWQVLHLLYARHYAGSLLLKWISRNVQSIHSCQTFAGL